MFGEKFSPYHSSSALNHSARLVAVIDIGTNSVRLLIAQKEPHQIICLKQKLETTRLGRDLKKRQGVLTPEGIKVSYQAVENYYHYCQEEGVSCLKVIGTSALREAVNGDEFVKLIGQKLNLEVEILSEKQEAFLSYHGAVNSLDFPEQEITFIDVGGGSTEVVWRASRELKFQSFPAGALRLQDDFVNTDPPAKEEIQEMENYVSRMLQPYRPFWGGSTLLGTGGTVTSLAAVKKGLTRDQPQLLHGVILKQEEVENMLHHFLSQPKEQRQNIVGLPSDRADIIIPGTLMVNVWLKQCGKKQLVISEGDLLAGAITEKQRIII